MSSEAHRSDCASTVRFLDLSEADLAEIGGVSVDVAKELMAEQRDFPEDLFTALEMVRSDLGRIRWLIVRRATRERRRTVYFFKDKADLRAYLPNFPCWGKSGGAFIGPYNSSAERAVEQLEQMNIEIEQVHYDRSQGSIEPVPDTLQALLMGLSNEEFREVAEEVDSWTDEERANFVGIDPSEVMLPPPCPNPHEAGPGSVAAQAG